MPALDGNAEEARGQQERKAYSLNKAIRLLEGFKKEVPTYYPLYPLLGDAYERMGQRANAYLMYKAYLTQCAEADVAPVDLADVRRRKNECEPDFAKPKSKELSDRACVAYTLGDVKRAAQWIDEAEGFDSTNPMVSSLRRWLSDERSQPDYKLWTKDEIGERIYIRPIFDSSYKLIDLDFEHPCRLVWDVEKGYTLVDEQNRRGVVVLRQNHMNPAPGPLFSSPGGSASVWINGWGADQWLILRKAGDLSYIVLSKEVPRQTPNTPFPSILWRRLVRDEKWVCNVDPSHTCLLQQAGTLVRFTNEKGEKTIGCRVGNKFYSYTLELNPLRGYISPDGEEIDWRENKTKWRRLH